MNGTVTGDLDRSKKETGFGKILPGMSLLDLHAPVYLSTGNEICLTARGGESIEIPLFVSAMTGENHGNTLTVEYELTTTNYIGETEKNLSDTLILHYEPWIQQAFGPLRLTLPDVAGLAQLDIVVRNGLGKILHRNFMHIEIQSDTQLPGIVATSMGPQAFAAADWSKKQWNVREGRKVNGAGKGFFEYEIPLSDEMDTKGLKEAHFLIELSAKELFVKDQQDFNKDQDYMKGSRVAPSSNPNSYPMTDEAMFPSTISISVNGKQRLTTTLSDDPADHRGVLSWHHQLEDRKLREAGSYGYLVKVPVSKRDIREAVERGKLHIRIQTEGEGGIAVYGKEFGRYPLDPTLVVRYGR